MFNAIFRLRRDNHYNYNKIKDTFVPQNGEICLVDTARDGLRAVCGDGKTPFGQLGYMNDLIVKGKYEDGKFISNDGLEVEGSEIKLYIDSSTNKIYHFDGNSYILIAGGEAGSIPTASAKVAGIVKLYNEVGDNTDGTMTQKAITDELEEKVEVEVIHSEELLIFT
jgi:hypothetical protein